CSATPTSSSTTPRCRNGPRTRPCRWKPADRRVRIMRFGVALPSYSFPDLDYAKTGRIRDFAQRAEALGYESLWAVEHLLTARGLYGTAWLSPLETLSFAAGCTERIRLATGILIAALRNPVFVAKEIASLQYLSGGRFELGIGVGWLARAAGSTESVIGDWAQIQARLAELGRAPDSVTFGHLNFLHIVPTDDEAAALRVQRPLIERIMGTHRSFEHLRQCYFLGSPRQIRARIAELAEAGLEYLVLSPLDYDLEQF